MFHARDTQASKADSAGAQQGGDMYVIQTGRQRKGEVAAREGIFGIAAIHRIPREGGPIAQIFHSVTAVPAIAIYTAHPGNTDSRSQRQFLCRPINHLADDLMARDELLFHQRQVSFHDVQVRATDPTRNNPQQDMPGFRPRPGDVLYLKERSGRLAKRRNNGSFHVP